MEIIEMEVTFELNGVKLIEDWDLYLVEWQEAGRTHRQIYYSYDEALANVMRRVQEADYR